MAAACALPTLGLGYSRTVPTWLWTSSYLIRRRHVANLLGPPGRLPAALPPWPTVEHQRVAKLRLLWSRMEGLLQRLPGGSQDVFEALYGWETDTFWLDRWEPCLQDKDFPIRRLVF